MSACPPPPEGASGEKKKHKCRYGAECRMLGRAQHTNRFWHEGVADSVPTESVSSGPDEKLSQDGDQHSGAKFPRMQCRKHPGCPSRWNCWYSHGLIHSSIDPDQIGEATCFLGQAPHNQGCVNPTWTGEPFDFCSKECREMANLTPKGPLGCRRENCKCPCTVNGMAGQFCCKTCYKGKPCAHPTHVVPTAHLTVVAKPQEGKYAPCAQEGCECAGAGGSSWNGEAGQFCCRACRNGTPCTKLWHTEPENLRSDSAAHAYVGFTCPLEGCENAPWNGADKEYCCMDHRHMAMGNYVPDGDDVAGDADPKVETDGQKLLLQLEVPQKIPFPSYGELWRHAAGWARSHTSGAQRGVLAKTWFNESLTCVGCPSRIQFEKAVKKSGCNDFRKGEFGWHGTKSVEAVNGICWSNLDTARRSGQAYGPGEYFSRGTQGGLNYSEGYAGGTAGNLLIIFWIMDHTLGAAPANPSLNGAGISRQDGHIVVNNPTTGGANQSNGLMYCVPVGVVAFGSVQHTPNFRTFNLGMGDPDVGGLLNRLQDLWPEAKKAECDKVAWQAQGLMLKKSEALLKNAIEGTDAEALLAAVTQCKQHCLVDTTLLDRATKMIGPKCQEQLLKGAEPGGNPNDLRHAIAAAESLMASGAKDVKIDPKVLKKCRDRLPLASAEYALKVAMDQGDILALRAGIAAAADIDGLDDELFQGACKTLICKCEEKLRGCMDGTDNDALQKCIKECVGVNDALPKTFDAEESNYAPREGVPQIDESLIDEARQKMRVMKYENNLRQVVQQTKDGSADLMKLFVCLNACRDIEGVSPELLVEARDCCQGRCNEALSSALAKNVFAELVIAASMSDGIAGVNEDLLADVNALLLPQCDERVRNCEAELISAVDAADASAIMQAIDKAGNIMSELDQIQKMIAIPKSLYDELSQHSIIDASILATAHERRLGAIFTGSLALVLTAFKKGNLHVANLQLWIQQQALVPALACVSNETLDGAREVMVGDCEERLRSSCGGVDDLAALMAAISWSEGIEGVDANLLQAAHSDLVGTKSGEAVKKLEDQLISAIAGFDVSLLEHAISEATTLSGLPTDPNRGFGPRAVFAASTLQKGILEATTVKEAVPAFWLADGNDGQARIKASLLDEVRRIVVINKDLVQKARQRLVVVQAEALLRKASDGDNLETLLAAITKLEGIDGASEDLIAAAKAESVKKAESQISAACAGDDVDGIQSVLSRVALVKGIGELAMSNAKARMVEIAEEKLQVAVAGSSAADIRQAIADAKVVDGVTESIFEDAQNRIDELEKKCCCIVA